ncbi:MAG: hypothetical protein M3362_26850 [Acidobacteriota bacterium]|nr:hypothetical protein [Acidobacteriota bacterium]
MTVCPCCGFKFEGDLARDGCRRCGARAVGPPLSRPVSELPLYGRSVFVAAIGVLMLLTFLLSTAVALFEAKPVSFRFWPLMGAAETAAWRLKWVAIPASLAALWLSHTVCKSISRSPGRFAGIRVAHGGLLSSALAAVMMITFIGITIPARLRQRDEAAYAAAYAKANAINLGFLEYRQRFGTLPATPDDLKEALASRAIMDPDGSIAEAVKEMDGGSYNPSGDLAALPKKKARGLRGTALRNASLRSSDDGPAGGISFTRYELRLPGPDKKLGTDDDLIMRDGLITKAVEPEEQANEVTNKP